MCKFPEIVNMNIKRLQSLKFSNESIMAESLTYIRGILVIYKSSPLRIVLCDGMVKSYSRISHTYKWILQALCIFVHMRM